MFEGDQQRVTDWWDRSVPPTMSWSERTFGQVFVEVEEDRRADKLFGPILRDMFGHLLQRLVNELQQPGRRPPG